MTARALWESYKALLLDEPELGLALDLSRMGLHDHDFSSREAAFAQAFNSTELKTGISNSLAVIMMFGFVLGISAVIYGGFAIRRGDVDQGKMSIIGGAIIAAAPAVVFAFYKIFGIDSNSSVGIGNF